MFSTFVVKPRKELPIEMLKGRVEMMKKKIRFKIIRPMALKDNFTSVRKLLEKVHLGLFTKLDAWKLEKL